MLVVTGGAGFIGSNFIAELNRQGEKDILIVEDLTSDNFSEKLGNLNNLRYQDIFHYEYLDRIRYQSVTGVVHLGAITSTECQDNYALYQRNYNFSKQLLEFCGQRYVPFLYASSAATYGIGTYEFEDDSSVEALSKLRPKNMYAFWKHRFDMFCMSRVQGCYGIPIVGMKFFNVYGPGEEHKGRAASMVYHLAKQLSQQRKCELYSSNNPKIADGDQFRDFVSVDAVVKHIYFLLKKCRENSDYEGDLFNIGTGKPITFNILTTYVAQALRMRDYAIKYKEMPVTLSAQYQNATCANMTKLKELEGDEWFEVNDVVSIQKYVNYLKSKGLC